MPQEELSKNIGISRPSMAQIEQGNRGVKVEVLKKLAENLNFSMDEIMSDGFTIDTHIDTSAQAEEKTDVRISVPEINMAKFKNLILYILEKCAGKPNIGETVLYKLLYFSDFNYYELYEEHLSGASYRKLPNGPVPLSVDAVLKSMVDGANYKPSRQLLRIYTKAVYNTTKPITTLWTESGAHRPPHPIYSFP